MPQINSVNIPAYQRKRSLAAKARAGTKRRLPSSTKTRKRTTARKTTKPIEELNISPSFPSEDLFPDPLVEERSSSPVREMKICGVCDGYFDKIDVAVIQVTSPIRQGDILVFEKNNGLFEQEIDSMQINRRNVSLARSGSDIGIKVSMEPKVGTPVYKVI